MPRVRNVLALCGGRVLTPGGWMDDAVVGIDGEHIVSVGDSVGDATEISIAGRWVLPGIVDVHGDAFERCLAPRPSTVIPTDMVLSETDASLLAAGVTSAYWSITDAFEPGLRSRDTLRTLLDVLSPAHPTLRANTYVHVRHEITAMDDHDELLGWLRDGRIDLFSINDHARPDVAQSYAANAAAKRGATHAGWAEALLDRAVNGRDEGMRQCDELCAAAVASGVVVASHDDGDEAAIDRSLARGATICEFPETLALFERARAGGAMTLMGAPNLVRGGSHTNFPSVTEAAESDLVDCLCSDYHYMSMLHAPFIAADRGLMSFERAWEMVSTAPARAAGLGGRTGAITPALDADLLVIDPTTRRLESVWVRGREVARWA